MVRTRTFGTFSTDQVVYGNTLLGLFAAISNDKMRGHAFVVLVETCKLGIKFDMNIVLCQVRARDLLVVRLAYNNGVWLLDVSFRMTDGSRAGQITYIGHAWRGIDRIPHMHNFQRFDTFRHLVNASRAQRPAVLLDIGQSAKEMVYFERAWLHARTTLSKMKVAVFLNDAHSDAIFGQSQSKDKTTWACASL